jgi:hypothetical protein
MAAITDTFKIYISKILELIHTNVIALCRRRQNTAHAGCPANKTADKVIMTLKMIKLSPALVYQQIHRHADVAFSMAYHRDTVYTRICPCHCFLHSLNIVTCTTQQTNKHTPTTQALSYGTTQRQVPQTKNAQTIAPAVQTKPLQRYTHSLY